MLQEDELLNNDYLLKKEKKKKKEYVEWSKWISAALYRLYLRDILIIDQDIDMLLQDKEGTNSSTIARWRNFT